MLQDDAIPCRDFAERLANALDQADENPLALFLPTTSRANLPAFRQAQIHGEPFIDVDCRAFCPVVALAWPTRLIPGFLAWADQRYPDGPKMRKADDAIVGDWAARTRQRVLATVPCLVEHPDTLPSLTGSRSVTSPARTAVSFIDG